MRASFEDLQVLAADRARYGIPGGSHRLITTQYYYYKTNTVINHKRSPQVKNLE